MRSEPEPQVPAEPVLRLEAVARSYRRGEERVAALRGIDLSLEAGTFVVVLGPSGGGKSTLLHLMGGMDRPDEGRVMARGRDIARLSSDEMAAYRRGEVGFVFQSFHLLPGRSALENVELPMLLAGVGARERRERALALLARVGLSDRADHRPGQLSGGQAQRVAIARALAMDPPVLLADEPTGNLDSESGRDVVSLLQSLAHDDGRTVVVVTHNAEFEPLADRVLRIRDGRLIADERPRPPGATAVGVHATARRVGTVPAAALVGQALAAAGRRLGRAVLTGLGVAIGIAAMILLVGLGVGLENGVVASITSLGPITSVTVSPQAVTTGQGFADVASGPTTPITAQSLRRFAALPGVRGAYASPTFVGAMRLGARSAGAAIVPMPPPALGTVPGILPTLAAGRWPRGPGEMVISQSTARAFLGPKATAASALGRRFAVDLSAVSGSLFGGGGGNSQSAGHLPTLHLRVVGVTGGVGLAYVPYAVALTWLRDAAGPGRPVTYPAATVLARSVSDVSGVARRISALGYGTQTMSGVVRQVQSSFGVIEAGLGAIGGIALVVAGLMIGVVMSMAVLERRREIGVLRAIGARRRDISRLFLSEAAAIGLAGGIVGVAVGAGVGEGVNAVVRASASGAFAHGIFSLPLWLVALGLAFGAGVAVVAGAIPAARAAALSPVDALRDE
jgi:ABC-type lipoprotein export system ATPase subunit/ABC-type antimicrobial peptide transport system permease subunit